LKLFLDAAAAGIANRYNTDESAHSHRDALQSVVKVWIPEQEIVT
jgi:hypothetical protein